jgi:hypothetical protein
MNLEYEFIYVATLKPRWKSARGSSERGTFSKSRARGQGKRLKGKVLAGGGDWLLIGRDGYACLDARAQFLTDDGASLYLALHWTSPDERTGRRRALETNTSTDYGDQYFPHHTSVRNRRRALMRGSPKHLHREGAGRPWPRRVRGVPRGLSPAPQVSRRAGPTRGNSSRSSVWDSLPSRLLLRNKVETAKCLHASRSRQIRQCKSCE